MPASETVSQQGASGNDPADLRVVWVSPSYGYGGDLLYFKGIFAAFCQRFPATKVLVDPSVPYREAEDLPLTPGLTGWLIKRERSVGQADYGASVHIPKPWFPARLLATKPDAVITIEFTMVALTAIALAAITRRFAILLLVESDPAARGGSVHPLVKAVKRWACRRADIIQTCNEAGRRFLVETLDVSPDKIRVAPYLTSCPPRVAGAALAAPTERLRILFANSLTQRKGIHTLLDALAQLPGPVANRVAVTIVGEGPERAALEKKAVALDGPLVNFVGAQPYSALGKWYTEAEVLVTPSHADYRSLAGFEGLGYGLALIASTADGASAETLDSGATGIAVDPGNAAQISAAIARFAQEPDFLAQCRANAARLFDERFSFDRIAENLAMSLKAAVVAHRGKVARSERTMADAGK